LHFFHSYGHYLCYSDIGSLWLSFAFLVFSSFCVKCEFSNWSISKLCSKFVTIVRWLFSLVSLLGPHVVHHLLGCPSHWFMFLLEFKLGFLKGWNKVFLGLDYDFWAVWNKFFRHLKQSFLGLT
jgi:hypothetical protein